MSVFRNAAIVLFILSLPLLLITTNLRFAVNEIRLYEYGLNKYEVSAITGIAKERLQSTAEGLIHYFNSGETLFQGERAELFNKREISHFKDVKGLIQLSYRGQEISFAYLVMFITLGFGLWQRGFFPHLAKAALWGCGVTIAFLAFVGIWALVDFDSIFLAFHYIGFRNLLWMAQPGDLMIVMFPPGFFFDATRFLAAAIGAEVLILGGAASGYLVATTRRFQGTK